MNVGAHFLNGKVFRILRMPNGDEIFVVSFPEGTDRHDVDMANRNVFRVDRDGKVIWQITRIDYPDINWELKHQHAREEGFPGCIEPFIRFYLTYADGSTNRNSYTGTPPDIEDWVPGCKVELANLGIGTQWFSLDVDTGVAVEITPRGKRPW